MLRWGNANCHLSLQRYGSSRELNDLPKVTQAGDSGGWALSCSASSGVDSGLREGLRKLRRVWFLIGKEARNQGVGCGAHTLRS